MTFPRSSAERIHGRRTGRSASVHVEFKIKDAFINQVRLIINNCWITP